jgi:hypothetical protein
VHVPATVHPSASPPDVQSMHVPPLAPHVVAPRETHAVPAQQPLAHEVASHTHAPDTQRWPDAHGAPLPHAHAPAVHRSDRASQARHATPPVPHAETDGI